MSNVRCAYCGRYYKKIKEEDKCKECHKQYISIANKLSKEVDNVLSRLCIKIV